MSRIGKRPIMIPQGVNVTISDGTVHAKGPKGELSRRIPPFVAVAVEGDQVSVSPAKNEKRSRAMHGLARTLIQNLVTGVSQGFTRTLEINGVGYRAEARDKSLFLSLGYSHPIEVLLPAGVTAKVEKNRIELWGIDREVLGQLSAVIRGQRPPEPYKGKGIKYTEETIRRKVGKAGAS